MPMTLITGTPGAGKTLFGLEMLLKEIGVRDRSSVDAVRRHLHDKGPSRPVVVIGVTGLASDLFVTADDPMDWQDYDDGTLFFVDEVWNWWGAHVSKLTSDARFMELAKHRHRGMDFIMTTQMPSQVHPHVRGLVSPHLHVTRKFGTKATVMYEWPAVVSNPNSMAQRKLAVETPWIQPAGVYGVYQSATMHTIKRRFPLKVVMIPVVGLAVLGALGGAGYAAKRFVDRGDDVGVSAVTAAPVDEAPLPAKREGKAIIQEVIDGNDYLAVRAPRVPEIPSSAPVFDGREVTSYPRLYCMASGEEHESTCRCVTEQNTRVNIDLFKCVEFARWGGLYDEYRLEQTPQSQPQLQEPQPQLSRDRSGALPVSAAGAVGSSPGPQVDPTFGTLTRPGS